MYNPFEKYWKRLSSKRRDLIVSLGFPVVVALLVIAAISAFLHFKTTPPYVDPERYPIRGIDVSSHNGMMNLDAVREAGYEFIFIKASEGEDFKDSNFRLNYDKAVTAGLKTGAYHFFRFDKDGVAQAQNLLQAVGGRHLDLGLAVDVEKQSNDTTISRDLVKERLTTMIEYLNLKGYRVILYSNNEGYYDIIRSAAPGECLWICSFNSIPINENWTFWQYDHHGKVRGIRGDVDLDAYSGNRKEWEEFLRQQQYPDSLYVK